MQVARQKWVKNGQRGETKRYYVSFRDHIGRTRRVAGFTDKGQTIELGHKIERLVAFRAMQTALPPDLQQWLDQLPPPLLERLGKLDLIDAKRLQALKPIEDHIKGFEQSMLARGTTSRHATLVTGRLRTLVADCQIKSITRIDTVAIERYLLGRRQNEPRFGARTSNYYLAAIKGFARYLVREGHLQTSPVIHLRPINVTADIRRSRRPLSPAEVTRLIAAATRGPIRHGVSGPERALLYRMALATGLRRGELARLRVCDLDLESGVVHIQAAYAKNRRRDQLPLHSGLVENLRDFIRARQAQEPLFKVPSRYLTAPMLRADLKDAGVEPTDPQGRVVDFHALRHTFVSGLVREGVHPKVAQRLARHSTFALTMDVYASVADASLREAVERLSA